MSTKHVLINALVAVLFLVMGLLLGSAVAYSLLLPSNQRAQEELASKQEVIKEMDNRIRKSTGDCNDELKSYWISERKKVLQSFSLSDL